MIRTVAAVFSIIATFLLSLSSADAQKREVDVVLVLAVDTSGSVMPQERWYMQLRGYAAAFRSVEVIKAMTSGHIGAIAVTFVQWAGPNEQRQVVPWHVVSDVRSAYEFAAIVAESPRLYTNGYTYLGDAIAFSARLIQSAPYTAERTIIDISGDGRHRDSSFPEVPRGVPVADARSSAIRQGITINGLPILGDEFEIDVYFKEEVIGGPGAFIVVVENPDDEARFAEAIRKKLVLEISQLR